MREFKIGDKVIIKHAIENIGKSGVIIEVGVDGDYTTVEFNEPVLGGHTGGNLEGKDGHCRHYLPKDLTLIKKPKSKNLVRKLII